jgi:hypothetical protein
MWNRSTVSLTLPRRCAQCRAVASALRMGRPSIGGGLSGDVPLAPLEPCDAGAVRPGATTSGSEQTTDGNREAGCLSRGVVPT